MNLKSLIVIPARLESTRLPRKLLLRETGESLIQHTYESASRATRACGVIVATDSEEVADEVRSFGGLVAMTSSSPHSGTDRVAQLALHGPGYLQQTEMPDVFVNVQGDEPEISSEAIDHAIEILEYNADVSIATLATPIRSRKQLEDPSCVKVVFDSQYRALYFSRSVIPYPRLWDDSYLTDRIYFQHVGLYAYRRAALRAISAAPPCSLELVEKLEQLRMLHAGYKIRVGIVDEPTFGIDTAEDYAEFVRRQVRRRVI